MDQVMDGGRLPLEEWFWEMPVCTRWWTAATVLTSALVQCHMVTPFQLFYSFRAVFAKSQVWERRFFPFPLTCHVFSGSARTHLPPVGI
jgi:hypothetical protein